jgi:hypothetical protein
MMVVLSVGHSELTYLVSVAFIWRCTGSGSAAAGSALRLFPAFTRLW